jgi:hypothetical protein
MLEAQMKTELSFSDILLLTVILKEGDATRRQMLCSQLPWEFQQALNMDFQ